VRVFLVVDEMFNALQERSNKNIEAIYRCTCRFSSTRKRRLRTASMGNDESTVRQ